MAKQFQFRLEQVLNLRRQVEEVKVRELAVAKIHLLEVEEGLNEYLKKQNEFLDIYGQIEKESIFTVEQVMAYCDYKELLSKKESEYRERQNDWMLEVERRRREVVKVSKQRQLLEKLKDKKKRIHTLEVQNDEQKFLDEVSSIAFVRRERAKSRFF